MIKAILGRKLRMTQMFTEDGRVIPLTAIEVGPCPIIQVKTVENDGYSAIQIAFEQIREKLSNMPLIGHFKKAKSAPYRFLKEIRVDSTAEYEVGQKLDASAFEKGDYVDVSGKTKGRGFQGGIKRHNWGGGKDTHGSMHHRAIGSLGPGTGLGRVFKGKTLPGHYGNSQVTMQNMEVVKVDAENGLIFIRGGIPGPSGAVVFVRKTTKNSKNK